MLAWEWDSYPRELGRGEDSGVWFLRSLVIDQSRRDYRGYDFDPPYGGNIGQLHRSRSGYFYPAEQFLSPPKYSDIDVVSFQAFCRAMAFLREERGTIVGFHLALSKNVVFFEVYS